jgi:hypothetical protein
MEIANNYSRTFYDFTNRCGWKCHFMKMTSFSEMP